jgi:tRNA pseudouridine32 synthase/23S rRNA pseudouridine746 synthase
MRSILLVVACTLTAQGFAPHGNLHGGVHFFQHSSTSLPSHVQVFNPLTGRSINQTGPDNKKSKWYDFMHVSGGWIAHLSELVPIDLDKICEWAGVDTTVLRPGDRGKRSKAGEELNILGDKSFSESTQSKYVPDCNWFVVSPEIETKEDVSLTLDKSSDLPMVDQILFVHKPSNLLTLPGIGAAKQICLASEVIEWLSTDELDGKRIMEEGRKSSKRNLRLEQSSSKKRKNKKTEFIPRPCHRLDLDTSGVMVIALTPGALRVTSSMFEERRVQKTYIALVAGHLDSDHGFVEYPIGKVYNPIHDFNEFRCHIPPSARGNVHSTSAADVSTSNHLDFVENSLRNAKTEWEVCKRFEISVNNGKAKYTRVRLKPHTGRGHQLRLHCAAIGHPILGDDLHAPELISRATPRLCLHAEKLEMDISSPTDAHSQLLKAVATSLPPF